MSLIGLLNQTILVYAKTGLSGDGRERFGSGVSTKSRFQTVSKRTLLPRQTGSGYGNVVEIDAIAYVPAATTVENDYKVSYLGQNYKVISKYAVPGALGVTDHIKLELQKWQQL